MGDLLRNSQLFKCECLIKISLKTKNKKLFPFDEYNKKFLSDRVFSFDGCCFIWFNCS